VMDQRSKEEQNERICINGRSRRNSSIQRQKKGRGLRQNKWLA